MNHLPNNTKIDAIEPENDSENDRLRLWIRILRITLYVENILRTKLRESYNTTLPRFDVMALLYHNPNGKIMGDLSKQLMISNGNVTGIVARLVKDGMVIRAIRDGDRRTSFLSLTEQGKISFEEQATAHKNWINEILASFEPEEAKQLNQLLKQRLPQARFNKN